MNQEIKTLLATIKKAEARIRALRSKCAHANVKTKPGADTGNYDIPDMFWTELTCRECGARWDEDCKTKEVTRYNF